MYFYQSVPYRSVLFFTWEFLKITKDLKCFLPGGTQKCLVTMIANNNTDLNTRTSTADTNTLWRIRYYSLYDCIYTVIVLSIHWKQIPCQKNTQKSALFCLILQCILHPRVTMPLKWYRKLLKGLYSYPTCSTCKSTYVKRAVSLYGHWNQYKNWSKFWANTSKCVWPDNFCTD